VSLAQIQRRLVRLLEARVDTFEIGMEPFPIVPSTSSTSGLLTSRARWEKVDPDDNLRGAPELVIEVKSAWNTKRQLQQLAALCLANGAIECWVVGPEKQAVSVVRR
jgi:hypothetical protein